MKKKLVGILVVTLLIATVALPVLGTLNEEKSEVMNKSVSDDNENPTIVSETFRQPPWGDFVLNIWALIFQEWSVVNPQYPPVNSDIVHVGRVGIGTVDPDHQLHVQGDSYFDGMLGLGTGPKHAQLCIWAQDADTNPLRVYTHDSGTALHVWNNGGVGIGHGDTEPPARGLLVNNEIRITGGSDIAEPFSVNEESKVKPGMVVVIDSESQGNLKISDKPYDHCVAGIISGAGGVKPGIILTQEDIFDGSYQVSLAGRVYGLCDASFGSIKPGDLLTTSPTTGHAMKVSDYERAQGAIIGKAMTSLEEGQGLVLILVSLQ